MISSEFYDKYIKISTIFFLFGVAFYLIYIPLSSLTFGISGSIISFCWLAKDVKNYGVSGYKRSILKRYGLLIGLFIVSLRAELLGVLLFLLGYVLGQWYMIIKSLKIKK